MKFIIKSERPNHKYIRKYKGKNGKWVYVYKLKKDNILPERKDPLESEDVKKFIENIRNNSYETLGCFDFKGRLLGSKKGTEDKVSFKDDEEFKKIVENSAFTIHNHPNNTGGLSIADVLTTAHHRHTMGITVTKDSISIFKISWANLMSKKQKDMFTNFVVETYKDTERYVYSVFRTKISRGELSVEGAKHLHAAKICEILSDKFPNVTFEFKENK